MQRITSSREAAASECLEERNLLSVLTDRIFRI
jgi:hypothetical protein